MKPFVLVATQDGNAFEITSNIPDLKGLVFDVDRARRGERATRTLPCRCYPKSSSPKTVPSDFLTPGELGRILAECDADSRVGIIRTLSLAVAHVPGATAAIREWLESAEGKTRVQDPDSPDVQESAHV